MKKYYVGNSDIEGKGVFASQNLKKGEVIGLLHTINQLYKDYSFEELGHNHNHSETPNCHNHMVGNKRYLVASRDIDEDEELTTNYRLQPDLEQPENFTLGEMSKKIKRIIKEEIIRSK
jgi:SET domain-containing protein